jgi:hypothetical protein
MLRTGVRRIVVVGAALVLAACGSEGSSGSGGAPPISAEPYAPPTGPAGNAAEQDSPGPRRILLATSPDGVHFTRLEQNLSDQTNTPNLVVLPSGRILLYYTAYHLDGAHDAIGVAVSDDDGATWGYYKTVIDGLSAPPAIGDPDVVHDPATGEFVMYVTHGIGMSQIAIKRTTSIDGFHFTYEGEAFDPASVDYKDSLTRKVGSSYVQFTLHSPDAKMGRATSPDGTTFTLADTLPYAIDGENYVLSNWTELGDGAFRVFGFQGLGPLSVIKSFTTTDGVSLTPNPTTCLALGPSPLEKTFVKDAAVAKLANGMFLMAYVSEIP